LYLPYHIATLEGVMHGLYLLWWVQAKAVSPAAVATILATGDFALTLFEIPTGWVADRCGYRISLITGSALQIAGMFLCWFGRGIPGVLAATLVIALGDAFRSGADHAMLYRSCVALGCGQDFQRIEARTHAVGLIVLVGLVLAGGTLVDAFGFGIGWATETTLASIGLMLAIAMSEPGVADADLRSHEVVLKPDTTLRRVGEASGDKADASSPGTDRRQLGVLAALIVPASLLAALSSAALFIAQTAAGVDAVQVTLIVAIATCSEAAGSAFATRVRVGTGRQIVLTVIGAAIASAAFVQSSIFTGAVFALAFLVGLAMPGRAAAVQRIAADRVRARAASAASAADKAATSLALICAGLLQR
jgi:hypothetical protein